MASQQIQGCPYTGWCLLPKSVKSVRLGGRWIEEARSLEANMSLDEEIVRLQGKASRTPARSALEAISEASETSAALLRKRSSPGLKG